MKPLVSIIIPVYNAERYLSQTIQSAINQTWENKEIIIVNDGSTDDSLNIAKAFENTWIKVLDQTNKGAGSARNYGLRESSGDFIQFLDADDILNFDKIEHQLNILLDKPNCLIGCNWVRFKENIKNTIGPINPSHIINVNLSVYSWLIARETMVIHAWLTPKKLINKAGGWNEELSYNDDGEYFCRVVALSEEVLFTEQTIVFYRTEDINSMSTINSINKITSAYDAVQSFEMVLKNFPVTLRSEKAIANAYKEILYISYPKYIDIYNLCKKKSILKLADLEYDAGGLLATLVKNTLGWKFLKRLKTWLS
ncbi:MAG: glycosyltransferase family 2 protein [Pedobacter sp.]|nr:MAG: glycosyltransferase family 2 protein [Pedobacter sp.]